MCAVSSTEKLVIFRVASLVFSLAFLQLFWFGRDHLAHLAVLLFEVFQRLMLSLLLKWAFPSNLNLYDARNSLLGACLVRYSYQAGDSMMASHEFYCLRALPF